MGFMGCNPHSEFSPVRCSMLGVQDPVVADFAQQQGPQQVRLWLATLWPSSSALDLHSSHLACTNTKIWNMLSFLYSEQECASLDDEYC